MTIESLVEAEEIEPVAAEAAHAHSYATQTTPIISLYVKVLNQSFLPAPPTGVDPIQALQDAYTHEEKRAVCMNPEEDGSFTYNPFRLGRLIRNSLTGKYMKVDSEKNRVVLTKWGMASLATRLRTASRSGDTLPLIEGVPLVELTIPQIWDLHDLYQSKMNWDLRAGRRKLNQSKKRASTEEEY